MLNLSVRNRKETSTRSAVFTEKLSNTEWVASETVIIIIDMWQEVELQQINERTNEMVPLMNSMLNSLRNKGVLIIHAPSEGIDFYIGQTARLNAENTASASNFPAGLEQWNYWISTAEETAGYPVSQTVCPPVDVHQHSGIGIHDNDAISTNSREIWNLMELHGIKNVLVAGMFSNVCVAGRPFGLRNWVRYGKNTLLIRDMTDVLYEDDLSPYISHFAANDLMTKHIEKYICSSILSSDITGTSPFQFNADGKN
ncbi:MAG: hypothetical protein L3J71_14530 [Victivallaceae bacterium]|nr:hypothetical protein [Victivallaceae bacterium]